MFELCRAPAVVDEVNTATLSLFFINIDWRAFRESDAVSLIEGFQVDFVEAGARLQQIQWPAVLVIDEVDDF